MNVGKVLLALLVIWLAFIVIGIVIKALFWLFVIGVVAFAVTAYGAGKRRGVIGRR